MTAKRLFQILMITVPITASVQISPAKADSSYVLIGLIIYSSLNSINSNLIAQQKAQEAQKLLEMQKQQDNARKFFEAQYAVACKENLDIQNMPYPNLDFALSVCRIEERKEVWDSYQENYRSVCLQGLNGRKVPYKNENQAIYICRQEERDAIGQPPSPTGFQVLSQ